ncbi:MAG: FAD binding domain-containing protein, partial [Oscillospiraceae bacterium]|nr:FAD binding domain-containing protein [Oscillospiraceae bacterium]
MKPFNHVNAKSLEEAAAVLKGGKAKAIAGGADLLGTLKDNIIPEYPDTLVNLKSIPGLEYIKEEDGMLKIGALTRLADISRDETVKEKCLALHQATSVTCTPNLREQATIGGNIAQLPRCWYFRKSEDRFDCARKGGETCFAIQGQNRYHSIFGGMKTHTSTCAKSCPAGTDISGYMDKIRKGDWDEAAKIIMKVNPLPMITSRICPHPCQDACNQCQYGDCVNIHAVERSVGDYILANIGKFYTAPDKETGKKVAIIGAGPGGLTAAYFLRKAGHSVTVFERMEKAGGVMRYGVPHYRLPKHYVDDVVNAIAGMGVEIRTGVTIGKDISMDEIDKQYDGVYFGTGAWKQPLLGIGGEDLALFGLNFLVDVNTYLQKTIGNDVLVCGGGNVAMDVALTAKRLGA